MLFLANSIISQHIVSRIRFLQCFFVSSRHIFKIMHTERENSYDWKHFNKDFRQSTYNEFASDFRFGL